MKPLPVAPNSPELNLAEITMPSFEGHDDRKRRYLSYRLCGFSQLEARQRANITLRLVKTWSADDPHFAKIEQTDLLTLRKLFARDFVAMQFTRNMKLALDRDEIMFDKALDTSHVLTEAEHQYILKIRPLYTPDGLRAVEELAQSNKGSQEEFSFDQLLIISRRVSNKAFPEPAKLDDVIDAMGRVLQDDNLLAEENNANL